jgi:hypothetical protein
MCIKAVEQDRNALKYVPENLREKVRKKVKMKTQLFSSDSGILPPDSGI